MTTGIPGRYIRSSHFSSRHLAIRCSIRPFHDNSSRQYPYLTFRDQMLAKANRDYEANGPPPRNPLSKQLFPSSSPTPCNGDIRAQLKKNYTSSAFVPSSSPSTIPQPPFRRVEKKTTTLSKFGNGAGAGSLASLYGNSSSSFEHANAVIDLTGPDLTPTNTNMDQFDFDINDLSDDNELDLDYEIPKTLPTLPAQKAIGKENMPPPPMSTPSAKPFDWSSSPVAHLLPPSEYRARNSAAERLGFAHKRRSDDETTSSDIHQQTKPKKRMLPSSFKAPSSADAEIIGERVISKAVNSETPNSKARGGNWDPTASAIKESRKQLKKEHSAVYKTEFDESTEAAETWGAIAEAKPVIQRSETVTLSSEQQKVLQLVVERGKSCFFTGPAGTGKSVLMRAIIAELKTKFGRDSERVAVTASTGLAACNIGGITLHSFSGIGLGKEPAATLVKKIRRNPKAKNRWLKTKCLIIDEISMVDGQLFDKLDQIGRTIRNNGRPWGGIQLIITGDFLQLPPVPDGEQKESIFAFDARTWETSIDHTIGLTQVFRQKDPEFAGMLNEMRIGQISDKTDQAFKALSRPLLFDDGIESAQLFPTRAQVEGSNQKRMRDLPGAPFKYEAADTGDPQVKDKLLSNMMAPKSIELKKGAQVMLIKNLDDTLVNGSLGTVIGFTDERSMDVDVHEGGFDSELDANMAKAKKKLAQWKNESESSNMPKYPLVKFMAVNGFSRVILCQPEEWKVELPNGDVQAKRTQVPLILAWALSIHKAQGQTLDRVTVDLGRVFEKGQAYVALSRATSQHGLRVLGFDRKKVMAHPKVVDFYKKLYSAADASSMQPSTIADFIAFRKGAP